MLPQLFGILKIFHVIFAPVYFHFCFSFLSLSVNLEEEGLCALVPLSLLKVPAHDSDWHRFLKYDLLSHIPLAPQHPTLRQILPQSKDGTLLQIKADITKQSECQCLRWKKLVKTTDQKSSSFLKENLGGFKTNVKLVIESSWLSCKQKSVS